MNRHELTDEQWARVEPLLPPLRSGRRGRPYHDHRRILNGLLWLAKTGVPWRDLPDRFGPWKTVANRFYRRRRAGIWLRVLTALLWQADQRGSLDWTVHFIDSTSIRVHQHGAGARGGAEEAIGRSRGGLTTKIHVRADRRGRPVVLLLSAGHRQTPRRSNPCSKVVMSSALVAVGPAHAPNGSWRTRDTRAGRCGATANSTGSARRSRHAATNARTRDLTATSIVSATKWRTASHTTSIERLW